MPTIIPYEQVLAQARALDLRCVYYNSGAFAPIGRGVSHIVGWLGPADPTIRPDLPAALVQADPPFEQTLSRWLIDAWQQQIAGPAWLLPKAHWSFELHHADQQWLTAALLAAGIDTDALGALPNAAAVEFSTEESAILRPIVEILLGRLKLSDFAILFPPHRHLVTLHHHTQVWWQTPEQSFAKWLENPNR